MAERARLQRKIGRDAAHAKRALGDDRSTEEVAVKKATNAARPKGDDRSAAQVSVQKAADAARPKGDDASGLVHHIIIPTDRTTRTKLPLKLQPLHIYSMTSKMKGNRPVLCWGQEPWTGASG